ncbi:MAG: YkgJ family cysteine cluster protein [Candidatus Aminicenantes bacterium]|nr:YkgJ family cysteine cluster protein [Candidatus Aminicenantes bacterium]
MSLFESDNCLAFNLSFNSPFNFTCFRCGTCCYHRQIKLNSFEIERMTRFLSLPPEEFIARFLEPTFKSFLKNKDDGACIFLDGVKCSIHQVRPLVCRLYPLGLLFGPEGQERWGLMPLHPDCSGLLSLDKTVEDYLKAQGALPYLQFERKLRAQS